MELNQITLPTQDVATSVAFYRALGCTLLVETAHYVRFQAPLGTTTFSLHLAAPDAAPGQAVLYFECGALDARVAECEARGLRFSQAPTDQPWLWREARLHDPSGNEICLYRAGENRRNPPWRYGGQLPLGLQTPTLDTPRLLLRPIEVGDLADFLAINSDPEVVRYLPYPIWTGMDSAWGWYHRMQNFMARGDINYNAVVAKESGRVIGGILLRDWDAQSGRVEVGYLLGRSHWGQGLMREAVQAVMDYAFTSLQLRRMEAHIDARNLASQRMVQSLGFQREAVLRDNWFDKDELTDSTIYGLLRREWQASATPG